MALKKGEVAVRSSAAEYLTFVASTGESDESFEMRYENENIWLTQKMMAALYDVEVNTINYHIKKIFSDSELQEDSVIRGSSVNIRFYIFQKMKFCDKILYQIKGGT
jgi:hypothetical protein